ncbi:MAG: hypothetical protein RSF79_20300, partial [Janthinobacterium sp.]
MKTIRGGWYDRPQSTTQESHLQQDSWQGTLWLAPDFAILHGAAGATDSHAHYAHQLMLSTGAPFTAELDGIVHTARHLLVERLVDERMHNVAPAVTVPVVPRAVIRQIAFGKEGSEQGQQQQGRQDPERSVARGDQEIGGADEAGP